jgi:hypothetical protein
MEKIIPVAMNFTKEFGFVANHHAFWGIPIPSYAHEPQPTTTPPLYVDRVPNSLTVKSATVCGKWTHGKVNVLATRMPPLFHALHHTTIIGEPPKFTPRDSNDPKLPERGIDALVPLIDLNFDNSGEIKPIDDIGKPIPISFFEKKELLERSMKKGYFSTSGGEWEVSKIGLLGALWIVLLNEDGTPALFDKELGDGYRLWHYLSEKKNLFTWTISHTNEGKKISIIIEVGKSPDGEVWKENFQLTLDLEWS